MAQDQTEKILYEVRLNAEQLKAEADKVRTKQAGLTTSINATRLAQKALQTALKDGAVSEADYGTQAQKLSEQLRSQTKEQAAATKELDSLTKVQDSAAGSIDQLRAELALTTAAYNALSKEQRENSQEGQALQARTRAISDELKTLESAVGDTRRNVGNYSDALKGLGSELVDAAKNSDLFGGAVGRLEAAQQAYAKAQELAKLAMGSATGAAGGLRVAMLAIPVFALIAGLALLFGFFTKTQQGADFVAKKTAAVTAVFTVLTGKATTLGEQLFAAFDNPKQAAANLSKFLLDNLLNRFKAFGVIYEAIVNKDFSKLTDGVIQATTGIADGSAKMRAFGAEVEKAATAGERLAAQQQQLNRDLDDNIDTNKRLLNEVERLKNIRDNEFNTLAVRRQANEDAYKVEQQREATLADLAARRVEILRGEIELAGGRNKVSREQFQELKEAENELADIREDPAGKQNELITNRYQLAKEGEDKLKELAEKAEAEALARLKDRNTLQQAELDAQLRLVAAGSQEELSLLRQKLARQRELELADRKLSADARRAIEVGYRSELEQLDRDHLQKLREQAAESQQTAVATQLAQAREGSNEQVLLKAQAIQAELTASLAGIDRRQTAEQQAAQEDRIRAEATKAQADLELEQALASLDAYLTQQRTLTKQQYADGQLTKAQHEAALQAIEQAGQAARIVTLQDYGRTTTAEEEAQSQHSVQIAEQTAAKKKEGLATEDQLRQQNFENARAVTDGAIELLGEETAAGQAALVIKKTLAVAEIAIGLQKQLAANAEAGAKISASAPPVTVPLGIAYTIGSNILSVAGAVAATAKVLAFADGGVLRGPSHSQGGIPFTVAGRPAFEAEGDEIILAKGVHRNPSLRPLASMLNVLGGGKPLYGLAELRQPLNSRFAEGGIVRFDPAWMPQMSGRSGGSAEIDYEKLGEATARYMRPVFAQTIAELPTPELSITELRTKQEKVTRNEQRADL